MITAVSFGTVSNHAFLGEEVTFPIFLNHEQERKVRLSKYRHKEVFPTPHCMGLGYLIEKGAMTMTEKKRLTREDLYELKSVANPQLSPDGNKISFVQTTMNEKTNGYDAHLFVVDRTGATEAKQWTFGNQKDTNPQWSPDGSQLAFVSTREKKPQIYVLSLDGGEARPLTEIPNGATNPHWSPDGKTIAFQVSLLPGSSIDQEEEKDDKPAPLKVVEMKYKSDARGFHDEKKPQVATVDVSTGEVTLLTEGEQAYNLAGWTVDGESLLVWQDEAENRDESFEHALFTYEVAQGTWTQVSDRGSYHSASPSPNGAYIAWLGHHGEYKNATHADVWLHDVATGVTSNLTQSLDLAIGDFNIGDFQQNGTPVGLQWNAASDTLTFTASKEGNTNMYQVTVGGEVSEWLTGEQHVTGASVAKDGSGAAVTISTPTQPGDVYWVDGASKQVPPLTAVNADVLAEREVPAPVSFTFTRDGYTLQGWYIQPVGLEAGEKAPVVVEVHGGPHAMYGHSYMHEFQVLAAAGFGVLYTNPRGSLGYGQDFVDAVRGDYGGGDYEDVMALVDHAVANFDWVDEDRLGITGGSYGGFMTNWVVGHTNRFKGAVTQRSISNWTSFYGVSDIGYYFTEWQIGGDFADLDTLWKHSPLAHADNIETPLLILHGEKDYRCPIEQAEQLFIALKRRGKTTEFYRFPDSNHELSRSGTPSLRMDRYGAIVDWMTKYVKETSASEKEATPAN